MFTSSGGGATAGADSERVDGTAVRPAELGRPPRLDLWLLVVAVLGVSTSAPLIRRADVPSLAMSFWRNLLAAVVLGLAVPLAAPVRKELRSLRAPQWRLVALAGTLLAIHFALWVPSLSYTSIASSTALVATQPIWAAAIARGLGRGVPRLAWTGIALGFFGALAMTGVDWQLSTRALFGDLLALTGGILAAAYVTVAAAARREVSATVFALGCYSVAATVLLAVTLASSTPLTGFDRSGWACIAAITVTAQLGGHALFGRVLRTTSPTIVSVAILGEIVGATLLGWTWFGEAPALAAVPGGLLIVAGVTVVVLASDRRGA